MGFTFIYEECLNGSEENELLTQSQCLKRGALKVKLISDFPRFCAAETRLLYFTKFCIIPEIVILLFRVQNTKILSTNSRTQAL